MHAAHLRILEAQLMAALPDTITVDHWNSQPSHTDDEALLTPAVFFDFGNVQWRSTGSNVKQGLAKITAYCVSTDYLSTRYTAEDTDDERFRRFDWSSDVLTVLDGFAGKDMEGKLAFTRLELVNSIMDIDHDGMKTDILVFNTQLYYYHTWREVNWQEITLESIQSLYNGAL